MVAQRNDEKNPFSIDSITFSTPCELSSARQRGGGAHRAAAAAVLRGGVALPVVAVVVAVAREAGQAGAAAPPGGRPRPARTNGIRQFSQSILFLIFNRSREKKAAPKFTKNLKFCV